MAFERVVPQVLFGSFQAPKKVKPPKRNPNKLLQQSWCKASPKVQFNTAGFVHLLRNYFDYLE